MALSLPRTQATNSRLFTELAIFGTLSAAFLALLLVTPHGDPSGVDRALMRDIQGIPWGSFSFIPHLGSDIGGGMYGAYLMPAVAGVTFAAKSSQCLVSSARRYRTATSSRAQRNASL